VQRILDHDRFRLLATINDSTIDDIVFPISEGLARRFIRFELLGASEDEIAGFLEGGLSDERKDLLEAALRAVREFFDRCDEAKKLTASEEGRRLPFGVGYFTPLRRWVDGRLRMAGAFHQRELIDQARSLISTSLRTAAKVKGFEKILRYADSGDSLA
jgi:hypothetical protein